MADEGVRRVAAAKINLYLHITGRVAAGERRGYHTLDSLVAFAAIGDVVSAKKADTLSLQITGPMAKDLTGDLTSDLADRDDDNLVLRAARALQRLVGDGAGAPGAELTLHKHLPVASGLGGGSADAAAALGALTTLWNLVPTDADLYRLALDLGADVPVCLHGKASVMTGVGEKLHDVAALPETHIVLVNPGVAVSTAQVFSALEISADEAEPLPAAFADTAALAASLAQRRNDLEKPARQIAPVIAEVLDSLSAAPACLLARMSGSGATCFGLFADETAALDAADQILRSHADWWVAATRLVGDTQALQEWAA